MTIIVSIQTRKCMADDERTAPDVRNIISLCSKYIECQLFGAIYIIFYMFHISTFYRRQRLVKKQSFKRLNEISL